MRLFFPKLLRQLRTTKGFSAVEFAKKIGVSKQAVSNMESGLALPSVEVFKAIGLTLGVSLDFLAGIDEQAPIIKPDPPVWLADLIPELQSLDHNGQKAVKALIHALKEIK
jgi:transcriptional regulator with XRE-family HTH domain